MINEKRTIRSFVHRGRKLSKARSVAVSELWNNYVIDSQQGVIDLQDIFKRRASTNLEIGFGTGENLYSMAESFPQENFIGIEVYRPGVAVLLGQLKDKFLHNLRIFISDAVEVLKTAIPNDSINKILIFFPDPWPKRRHHRRRLIQALFVELVYAKLQQDGCLHVATDNDDYANHILKVMDQCSGFYNVAGETKFIAPPSYRQLTKFEKRGLAARRKIMDLKFLKK